MKKYIELKGVRVNNLQNIDLKIPRNELIVIAGLSGSGKSSLAFDTLYAEGQRRYVESLSTYARQFMGRMQKPQCDYIKGLPPAIAIQQKVISQNPRSTVGTASEIYHYLRLLFARIGKTISPISGQEVKKHTIQEIVDATFNFPEGTPLLVLAPIQLNQENAEKTLQALTSQGFSRLWNGNSIIPIQDYHLTTSHLPPSTLFLVIDRLKVDPSKDTISRLTDSIETALYEGHNKCSLCFMPAAIRYDFSTAFEADGITFEQPTEHLFSFNSPIGACPTCEGFGNIIGIDERLVIPNTTLSVYDGCVQCWHGEKMGNWKTEFCRRAKHDNFPIFTPYNQLSQEDRHWLWHGLPSEANLPLTQQVSIDAFFQMLKDNQYKIQYRVLLSRYRGKTTCPQCKGTRLKPQANFVHIAQKNISQLVDMPISELYDWFANLQLTQTEQNIARRLLTEITNRLKYLIDVGLPYLTLNRTSNTLSGGEAQRVNLTTAIGSSLVGALYILDEPTIGLHTSDTQKLIQVLRQLKNAGNTVIVVEHDKDIIAAADYLIDVGPQAGTKGGEIVYAGPIKNITAQLLKKYSKSHTLRYLAGKDPIPQPHAKRAWNQTIQLKGARMNNLKGIDVTIPLNALTVVHGPSGSGKSTLIIDTLASALKRRLGIPAQQPGEYNALQGDIDTLQQVIIVDQQPIGKSARSNPATYTHAFDHIRQLFAQQPLAKQLNLTPQHFSFNAEGGRCEHCQGAGNLTIPMQFMADVEIICPQCHGTRFKSDILQVRYHAKNIHDVLHMTIEEAIQFFGQHSLRACHRQEPEDSLLRFACEENIVRRLQPLVQVGLSYLQLGQAASTLSGGENQRLKLATYLITSQPHNLPPHTLFIFDEPTTGLHHHDLPPLLNAFNALIQQGHTVIVIEHNQDIINAADYLIQLGPQAGRKGGQLIYQGPLATRLPQARNH